jgi:hypothetical protein
MKNACLIICLLAFATVSAWGQGSSTPPTLRIVTEDPTLPSELYYGDIKVKPLRLRPGTTTKITIDDSDFFVQQHYVDFLRRFPDQPGLQFWMSEISSCADATKRNANETEAQCVDRKRENTSGAYFLSTEFQSTGGTVYRLYRGGLNRRPKYAEMIPDQKVIANGIVVNNALSATVLEANKTAYAKTFAQRSEFTAKYPSAMTSAAFLDELAKNTGVALADADKTALLAELGGATVGAVSADAMASVLRKICDGTVNQADGTVTFSTTYGKSFYDKEFNSAFVLMQYFGYLRRDADDAGFNFWLEKLNRLGDYKNAQMVRSFVISDEYRNRF